MTFSQLIQSKVHEEPLGDFPVAAFLKFLLRDPVVERRYYVGELPHDLLIDLYVLLGRIPRFLGQIIEVLKTITTDDLRRELAAVKLPSGAEASLLREARDRYCEAIFTARLYGYLSPDSQQALSRAAVYGVPVSLAGLAAVTGEPTEKLRKFTRQWQAYALAYPEHQQEAGELWTVYSLLRRWLLAPERLGMEERRKAHRAAGNFLHDLVMEKGWRELGLSAVDCLLEARAAFLEAGDHEQARVVTSKLSVVMQLQGLPDELSRLNEELLEREEHPGPILWIGHAFLGRGDYASAIKWYRRSLTAAGDAIPGLAGAAWHALGTIHLRQKKYKAAREEFERSLAIREQISRPEGQAETLHELAMIDALQRKYGPAREKFQKALTMSQQVGAAVVEAAALEGLASIDALQRKYGPAREKLQKALTMSQQVGAAVVEAAALEGLASIDMRQRKYGPAREKFKKALTIGRRTSDRYREAETFKILGGLVVIELGHLDAGLHLLVLSDLLFKRAGAAGVKGLITRVASELNYTEKQLETLRGRVAHAYQEDGGWGLMEEAFRGLK